MANFKTIQDLMNHNDKLDKMGYCIEILCCYACESWYECPYAFDPYNIDNDCLANK